VSPSELENLAHPAHPRYDDAATAEERSRLSEKLADLEDGLARPLSS
jgi:hypothetical protein